MDVFGAPKPPMMATGPDPEIQSQILRRLRMVEESLSNTRKKIELDEQNSLREFKKNTLSTQDIIHEVDDMKRQIRQIKDDLIKMIGELQNAAKHEEVAAIQKYVDFWEPIHFVTHKEVDSIVADAIQRQLAGKPPLTVDYSEKRLTDTNSKTSKNNDDSHDPSSPEPDDSLSKKKDLDSLL